MSNPVEALLQKLDWISNNDLLEQSSYLYRRSIQQSVRLADAEVARAAICIELAAMVINKPVNRTNLLKNVAVAPKAYKNGFVLCQNILGLKFNTGAIIDQLCVIKGGNFLKNAAYGLLNTYDKKYVANLEANRKTYVNISDPVYHAVAFFLAAKDMKVTVERRDIVEKAGVDSSLFSTTLASFQQVLSKGKKSGKSTSGDTFSNAENHSSSSSSSTLKRKNESDIVDSGTTRIALSDRTASASIVRNRSDLLSMNSVQLQHTLKKIRPGSSNSILQATNSIYQPKVAVRPQQQSHPSQSSELSNRMIPPSTVSSAASPRAPTSASAADDGRNENNSLLQTLTSFVQKTPNPSLPARPTPTTSRNRLVGNLDLVNKLKHDNLLKEQQQERILREQNEVNKVKREQYEQWRAKLMNKNVNTSDNSVSVAK